MEFTALFLGLTAVLLAASLGPRSLAQFIQSEVKRSHDLGILAF
jgi:hypothetical protein